MVVAVTHLPLRRGTNYALLLFSGEFEVQNNMLTGTVPETFIFLSSIRKLKLVDKLQVVF